MACLPSFQTTALACGAVTLIWAFSPEGFGGGGEDSHNNY
jgi:hypothetical protein